MSAEWPRRTREQRAPAIYRSCSIALPPHPHVLTVAADPDRATRRLVALGKSISRGQRHLLALANNNWCGNPMVRSLSHPLSIRPFFRRSRQRRPLATGVGRTAEVDPCQSLPTASSLAGPAAARTGAAGLPLRIDTQLVVDCRPLTPDSSGRPPMPASAL